MRWFLLALMFGAILDANAESVTLTFDNATTTEDGGPLTGQNAIVDTFIAYNPCLDGQLPPAPNQLASVPYPETEITIDGLATDLLYCARAFHRPAAGEAFDSSYSNLVTFTLTETTDPVPPNPPGNLTVTVNDSGAYRFLERENKILFARVGDVMVNTTCDSEQVVGGYRQITDTSRTLMYVVPRDRVTWSGSGIEPDVVLSPCS